MYLPIIFLCEYFQISENIIDFTQIEINVDLAIQLIDNPYAIKNNIFREKISKWYEKDIHPNDRDIFLEKLVESKTHLQWVIASSIMILINNKPEYKKDIAILNFFKKRYTDPVNYRELIDIFSSWYCINPSEENKTYILRNVVVLCNQIKIHPIVMSEIINSIITRYDMKFE